MLLAMKCLTFGQIPKNPEIIKKCTNESPAQTYIQKEKKIISSSR
jgi:hypothetical protein